MAAIKMSSQGCMWLLVIGELSQLRIHWETVFKVKLQTKSDCISNFRGVQIYFIR